MSLESILEEAQSSGAWLAHRRAAEAVRDALDSQTLKLPKRVRAAFVGSFTLDPLVHFVVVEAARAGVGVDTYVAPYGQFAQELLSPTSGLSSFEPDITVLLIEFDSLATPAETPDAVAGAVVRQVTSLTNEFSKRRGTLIVSTFSDMAAWPLHILRHERSVAIREANRLLWQAFAADPRIQICDVDELAAYYGRREAFSPEMLHMARQPFSEGFLALLARKLVGHLKSESGLVRKCLVLDCDNTLWGGVVGEDGLDGIALGPDWPGIDS